MKISSTLTLGCALFALAAASAYADPLPVLEDASGHAVRDASGTCVLTSGRVLPECGGPMKVSTPAPAPSESPSAAPAPTPAPVAEPAKPAPQSVREAIVIQADALFDFDKSVVRPDGRRSIDAALEKIRGMDIEMVIATGHTDSIGTEHYNQKLSERRAAAVKAYLVSKGFPAAKVTTIGKGETQPVATNKTKEGRQKNRRVDIEFKGVHQ
jgi:OOP family OmpA-OmpF porin